MAKEMSKPLKRRASVIKRQYKKYLKVLSPESQKHQILKYMMENRSITQAEAVEHLDCYRLGARIIELRDMGCNITTHMEDNTNKRGQHGRYFLEELEG